MNIASLSDFELHTHTIASAKSEKLATLDLLNHLIEINRRKLFVEYGHSTIHKYVVSELKYSPAEAWTRIHAMKLIRDSLPARKSFSEGKLTLSNASLLQENKKSLAQNFDQMLIASENKSFRELEELLSEKLGRPKTFKKIELPQSILEKMKRLKISYGNISELELIEALLDKELKQIDVKNKTVTDQSKITRYISKSTRAIILRRADFQCEATQSDGTRCRERRNLEFEHIHPFAKGGNRDVTNLELLCRNHNARRKFNTYGADALISKLANRGDLTSRSPSMR